jgi:dihydroxyacid dehydratase/phosphogluconate dehydratase
VNSYAILFLHTTSKFWKLVKGSREEGGGIPFEFNKSQSTMGFHGHAGMKYSLPSRE